MNICMCGTEAGYPHRADCPYPLYRCSAAQEAAWEAARDRLLAQGCEACGKPCPGHRHCSLECATAEASRRDGALAGLLGE